MGRFTRLLCLWIAVSCLAALPLLAANHLGITNARVYPNPFNPDLENATIAFDLDVQGSVELEITAYDWAGDFVDRIYEGAGSDGPNAIPWGGQTEDGRKLGNGMYLIRVVASTDARKESVVLKSVVWND